MSLKDLKIGEAFELDGFKCVVTATKERTCFPCIARTTGNLPPKKRFQFCALRQCTEESRMDMTNVIFKEVT